MAAHDARTVPQGWAGQRNGDLLALAEGQFDVFLTVDRNLSFQNDLHRFALAVVVLHATSNKLADLRPLVPALLLTLGAVARAESSTWAGPALLRRPSSKAVLALTLSVWMLGCSAAPDRRLVDDIRLADGTLLTNVRRLENRKVWNYFYASTKTSCVAQMSEARAVWSEVILNQVVALELDDVVLWPEPPNGNAREFTFRRMGRNWTEYFAPCQP